MRKKLSHFLIILSIVGLILPNFSFIQAANQQVTQPPKIPENWDEILTIVQKALNIFPTVIKGAWQEALTIWRKMANFFKDLWNSYIWPKIEKIWIKILSIFGKEVEMRKEKLPGELEKEKKELLGD